MTMTRLLMMQPSTHSSPALMTCAPSLNVRRSPLRARHFHNDTLYTRSSTHVGNSLIYYRPGGDSKLDLIPWFHKVYLPSTTRCRHLCRPRHLPVPDGTCDPFRHSPDFPAKLYSTQVHDKLDIVQPDWVVFQFARWNMSADYAVILSLPRVRVLAFISKPIQLTLVCRTNFLPGCDLTADAYCKFTMHSFVSA